jgi:hypothetical protein
MGTLVVAGRLPFGWVSWMNFDPLGYHCIVFVDLAGIRLGPIQPGRQARRIA